MMSSLAKETTKIEWPGRAVGAFNEKFDSCPLCGVDYIVANDGHTVLHPGFTFNAWWGCEKVSPACKNCYAATFDHRYGGEHWGADAPRRFFGDAHWTKPHKWNRHAMELGIRLGVFCMSMGDVFEKRDDLAPWRTRLWALINETPSLDWMLLTKRPEWIGLMMPMAGFRYDNVWLGVTAENQEWADKRLPILKRHDWPAKKFISYEPALGDVKWELDGIDLLIAGDESGHGRRTSDSDWYRSARDQADEQGVPFFLKQRVLSNGTKVSLPMLDGQQHAAIP